MKRIEIIGAPYVGKSTLLKRIGWYKTADSPWITELEEFNYAPKQKGYFHLAQKKILKRYFPHTTFSKRVRYYDGLDYHDIDSSYIDNFKVLLDLCFLKTTDFKEIKLALIVFHKMIRRIAKLNCYQIHDDRILLVEEFILHWHLVLLECMYESKLEPAKWINDEGLSPAGLIFCWADEDVIVERMEFRKQSNQINKIHVSKTNQDVIQDVLAKQEIFKTLASYLQKNKVPVLTVNTGDPYDYHCKLILKFINSVRVAESLKRKNFASAKSNFVETSIKKN
ncbi:MAG: hypothetical protein WD491_12055 [Balneolales bacterium]